MKTNFLKHSMAIGGGTLFSMVLSFFTVPIITRIVEPASYGQYSLFTLYVSIGGVVLCLGLDQALIRFFYESDEISYKRQLLQKCVKIPLYCCIIVSLILLLLGGKEVFGFDSFGFILLCVNVIGSVVYRFSQLVVRLQFKTKLYSMLGVLQKFIYFVISIPLLYYSTVGDINALLIATTLALVGCLLVSILSEVNYWKIVKTDKITAKIGISNKELIHYAFPYIFTMGITSLFQALDKLALDYYHTDAEVGIYASSMTLANVFAIIHSIINTLWAPMAVEHYAKDQKDRSLYVRGNQVVTVIMFFFGVTLILFKDILAMLLGEEYRETAYILPFQIFSLIMYTISETTVSGLVFMKKSKVQVFISVIACVTNFVGNTLLVPQLGCQGAAISTGISYLVFLMMRTLLSNRYFYVDFRLKRFYLITVIVIGYAFYNTFAQFGINSIIGYLICLGTLIVLYRDTISDIIDYCVGIVKK